MAVSLRQFAFWFLLLWEIPGLLSAAAEEIPPAADGSFLIRSWQTQQGLPNDTVNAITQTHDGYIWLGTDDGLARFDGVRCRVFGLGDGLKLLQISALLEDHQGRLWIGTDGGGLSRLFDGKIETFTVKDGLAGDSIRTLMEDKNGDIWVGTPTGLSRWRNGKFDTVASVYVFDLAEDKSGKIWAATLRDGLLCFQDGKFTAVGETNLAPRCVLADSQGRLWVASRDKYISCLDNGSWIRYGTNSGLPETYVFHITQTADGTIWAGSLNKGLFYFRAGDQNFHALSEKDALPDSAVLALYADRDQHLWVGTQSGGVSLLGPKKLSVHHVMAGGSECLLRSLAETTNGDFWVGTYGQGLFQQRGDHYEQSLTELPMSAHLFVEALLGARDGSLWWGTGPAIFQRKDGQMLANFNSTPWLYGDRVLSLCEAHGSGIWVGTYNGQLRLLKDGKFSPVTGLSGKPVTALVEETNGTLWIGSLGGGLARLPAGSLAITPANEGLRSKLIRTLYLDSSGMLWVGTDGGGLAFWFKGRLTSLTTQAGLIEDDVLQILDDNDGGLWLGGNRGICRINKQALFDVAEGRIAAVRPLIFGSPEGVFSEQCVGNFGAALKSHSGQLCFSTARGIVIIDPTKQTNNAAAPMVVLEDLLVDGQPPDRLLYQTWDASAVPSDRILNGKVQVLQIPPGRHTFEFHYTGLNFDAPERIRFKYRLKGFDPGWTEVGGAIRVAHYNYVPPGRYVFQVMAGNSNGRWDQNVAEAALVVLPHFWQNGWFEVATALIFLSLLACGIRYVERRRYRARLKRLEQERAMEQERARIARDLHDELGASLARISVLSDLGQTRDASVDQFKQRVEKISKFAIRTARSLDEIVWAVNPRNDSLRSLLLYVTQFSQELFEDTPVQCRYQIADDLPPALLPPDLRHNLFLVIKEALNNVLKHARANQVFLQAKSDSRQLEIIIQDNGAGFDPASPSPGERNGVANMRHRMETVGGTLTVTSQPGAGTTIKLIISCDRLPVAKVKPQG